MLDVTVSSDLPSELSVDSCDFPASWFNEGVVGLVPSSSFIVVPTLKLYSGGGTSLHSFIRHVDILVSGLFVPGKVV